MTTTSERMAKYRARARQASTLVKRQVDGNVTIDGRGFVSIDGVKVCRLTENGRLQFCDKDKRRSEVRGTRYVEISAEKLASIAKSKNDHKE